MALGTRAARFSLGDGAFGSALMREPRSVLGLILGAVAVSCTTLVASSSGLSATISKHPFSFIAFCVVGIALAWTPIEIYGRGSLTFAGAGMLATSFTFGIGAAMVAAFLVALVVFVRNKGLAHRALYNAATLSLSAAFGGAAYELVTFDGARGAGKLAAALLAGAVFYLVNIGLLCVVMAAAEETSAVSVWQERFRWLAPYYLASGALALAIAVAYERIGLGGLAAFTLPPAFMMLSTRQYLDRTRESVDEVRRSNEDLAELLKLSSGLAARAHNRQSIIDFAEVELSTLTGGTAHLSHEPSPDFLPLVAGGAVVGWLRLRLPVEGSERWERIKDTVLPSLATALENASLLDRVLRGSRDLVAALSRSLEAKDYYTGGHTERVAEIAAGLARRLGFQGEDLEAIEIGALVHDIGKVGVPEAILNKPGALDHDEWMQMKRHPIISDAILRDIDLHPFVRQAARSSHERIDGCGYPDALRGEDVPIPARIVLVADAWDALTSDRPYRSARSAEAALTEIRENAGTQFCPAVVQALEQEYAADSPALRAPAGKAFA